MKDESGSAPSGERALLRLRQIAGEQSAAIRAGDSEMLCRLAELLPEAVEAVRSSAIPSTPETLRAIEEIRGAQVEAERYLESQLVEVRMLLQQNSAARTALRAYGAARPTLTARGVES